MSYSDKIIEGINFQILYISKLLVTIFFSFYFSFLKMKNKTSSIGMYASSWVHE